MREHSEGGAASLRVRSARLAAGQDGFGLVEMMVAMTIMAVVMLTLGAQLGAVLKVARNNRNRTVAANLASREMDIVRNLDFPTLSTQLTDRVYSMTVDGFDYTVTRNAQLVSQTSTSGPCDGGAGNAPAFVRVTVAVTWTGMGSISPVGSQTVITPPVGSYDPNTGHVAVKILNRNAQPLSGQAVTLSGTATGTEVTASDGCVFFGFKAAGASTVALSSAGYVDAQGTQSSSSPMTVTVGQTTSVAFDYDLASTINATLQGPTGYTVPSNVAVSLANNRLLPAGVKEITGTGTSRTFSNLFPFADGYEYFAGDCADADPEGVRTTSPVGAYYPGAQRPSAVATAPQGTASMTVPFAGVDVQVRDASGVAQGGATVTPYHRADSGCSATTLTSVTADSAGIARIALPYGGWAFKATKGSKTYNPSNPAPTVTLAPGSGVVVAPTVTIS